tara:strand:- start:271 stop:666 length:396 start_codon:yes stop_codon:yes gene_type:complete
MTTTSEDQEKSVSFDVGKYTVGNTLKKETVKIEGTGDSFEVSIRPLTWAKRNQLISRHLAWESSGNTAFNGDGYVRDCLKEMIADAPWGKTTESFLISIDERLGSALESLVPKAFGADSTEAVEPDKVKKG